MEFSFTPMATDQLSRRIVLALFVVGLYSANLLLVNRAAAAPFIRADIPAPAEQAGYLTRTFFTGSFSKNNVDTGEIYSPGFQWYDSNILPAQGKTEFNKLNGDGSITTYSSKYNLGLISVARSPASGGYVGTAFGGGGYFEAEISFNSRYVNITDGWPAVWLVSVESLIGLPSQQWVGQPPGYNHTMEVDVFEYEGPFSVQKYGATVHEFYGVLDKTCPARCEISSQGNWRYIPLTTNWSKYHKVGMLWIPASSNHKGSITFFFDGVPIGSRIEWAQFKGEAPPIADDTPWKFGVIDRQHLGFIIGAGQSAPLTVKSVSVWQKSFTSNLTH